MANWGRYSMTYLKRGTVSSREESKSKTEHETWLYRGVCGDRSKRSIILTYISGSISVSQQNITKLEREAGRHANQCMNRWLNRSGCASGTGTSLVGRVRTRRTPNVRFTYKRRANAPADDGHVTPPHSPSSVSTYYGDTTFCDAMQLSPEPPPLPRCQPHHRRPAGTDVRSVRTRSAGAQVCVFFYHPPPPSSIRLSIRSFIRKNTHLDRPDRASVNAAPNQGIQKCSINRKGCVTCCNSRYITLTITSRW
ncbi:hypothetical protein ALC60_05772 [Trachymyrmex zeteki]|uniref:Uncharacterized protein n=1 Tax=Mycetomoellerius zeteki TaxID=64791 RepID=A0A151X4K5_9HYME|nr:hypothetical protein ALC60_05772 [Trachymyrmex zeteki]